MPNITLEFDCLAAVHAIQAESEDLSHLGKFVHLTPNKLSISNYLSLSLVNQHCNVSTHLLALHSYFTFWAHHLVG